MRAGCPSYALNAHPPHAPLAHSRHWTASDLVGRELELLASPATIRSALELVLSRFLASLPGAGADVMLSWESGR
ncbi:hypothetical protein DHEL01_v203167 [Diaporthe helianthi]|uniref:Uncharacterized protein n=1 Tax=Diaporthe helianthi TaxID=158607 RepID=A0A2P5I7G6_DIAHE|nr:hypothetical protein DHEL01_v203167 [Diaporthe helianthi]